MKKPLLIGLPGTGKTTTAHALCAHLAAQGAGTYDVVSTDNLFRVYRAIPLASQADGHDIMKNFINRMHSDYPEYADTLYDLANQTDDQDRCALHDSTLFRSIGADKHGENIFRTFEITMLSWLNAQGRFDQALADLSASAPLYDENRSIFSAQNGYHVILLEADESTTLSHLMADYAQHRAQGKTIRGGYEAAVAKALQNTTDNPQTVTEQALLSMHRQDRDKRMDKYRAFTHSTLMVTPHTTPQSLATQIYEQLI